MQPGDIVGYTADFCRSIQADYFTASRRGEVKAIEGRTALVLWNDLHSLQRVLLVNIAPVGSFRFAHNS